MSILWERATNKAFSHHPSAISYMEMFAKYNGWNDPKSFEDKQNVKLTVKLGDCEECKNREVATAKQSHLPPGDRTQQLPKLSERK